MRTLRRKGFVIILAVTLMSVLIIMAWAIINFGCGEILSTRSRNDLVISAYYVAIGGAEYMYAKIRTMPAIDWGSPPTASGTITVGSNTIGAYSVTVVQVSSDVLAVISVGTVNGRTTTAVVRYGYSSTEARRPVPFGSLGEMTIDGATNPAKIKMEGPTMSNADPTVAGSVSLANDPILFDPPQGPLNFWVGTKFDTNNDGNYAVDANEDGKVTLVEAQAQGKEAEFNADNAYSSDNEVNESDAFYYYYTTYLNDPGCPKNKLGEDLGIAPSGSHYYSGNQTFDTGDIANDVPIIFVDGDVTINYNDQDWRGGGDLEHTVVAMGKISIIQPTNRPGDILTLIANGDAYTSGTMGDKGGVIGDIVFYTRGDFLMENGGKNNCSIFAEGTATIDTIGDDQGKDHRIINQLTVDWQTSDQLPLGLPADYPVRNFSFTIKSESQYRPIWQRS